MYIILMIHNFLLEFTAEVKSPSVFCGRPYEYTPDYYHNLPQSISESTPVDAVQT